MENKTLIKSSLAIIFAFVCICAFKISSAYACGTLTNVEYRKDKVLDINVGDLRNSGQQINNGVVYIANRNSRLSNGERLPQGGLTVVSPFNVYIKGDFNNQGEGNWQPAAVITNSLVYILSDNFDDSDYQNMPSMRVPREYGAELNYIKTDNNYNMTLPQIMALSDGADINGKTGAQVKAELIDEIKSFFGLNNFLLPGSGTESGLVNNIRNYYCNEYNNNASGTYTDRWGNVISRMTPNTAQDTEIKVAIASPYDIALGQGGTWDINQSYLIEEWLGKNLNIEGAFIKLGTSWANQVDGAGKPILDWRGNPVPYRNVPWPSNYTRSGGPNAAGRNPYYLNNYNWYNYMYPPSSVRLEYEDEFANSSNLPSGDFLAGSESAWQEVSSFDHHTG